jgi:uncharacterized protein YjiK
MCAALSLVGCDSRAAEDSGQLTLLGRSYDTGDIVQYQLPKPLREISGLDLMDNGELLAHNDERAVVYRLDHSKGRILGSFRLGREPVRADFEGIASIGQRVFLITSTGALYETRFPLFDDERETALIVPYQRYQVGLPCEIEGLAAVSTTRLLAICKNLNDGDDVLRIYAWHAEDNGYEEVPYLSLDESAFSSLLQAGKLKKLKRLRPSGITVADDGSLLVLGRHGKDPAIIEIDPDGNVVSLQEFPEKSRHPQPEGIALTREAGLVVADEGARIDNNPNRKGRMGVYKPN